MRGQYFRVDAQYRPIALAISLSLFAHLLLLSLQHIRPAGFDDRSTVTDLRLWLEQPSDRDVKAPEVADVRRSSAPQPAAPAIATTAVTADNSAPAVAEAVPVAVAAADPSGAATVEPIMASTVEANVASVLTETDQSSEVVPAEAVHVEVTMASSERNMVTQQVLKWSGAAPEANAAVQELSWRHRHQNYTAHVERLAAADSMGIERAIVEVRTEKDGVQLKSRVQLRRLAFSNFTQFVDQWDQSVQLHDDTIEGRFHSNSEIIVSWDGDAVPRFLGPVSTAARQYLTGNTQGFKQSKQLFPGGLELSAPRIALPRMASRLADNAGGALERGVELRRFEHDTRIVFHADGSYSWNEPRTAGAAGHEQISSRPLQIMAVAGASLQVQGVVRGRVLVYSPEEIIISGDLAYASDAHADRDSADFLGLVSDRNVTIAPQRVTGPGNLRIDAAIYARERFVISDLMARNPAVLSIFGSLSAGSISASEPRYATKLTYDRRFERLRPPGFPMANRYEVEAWDGQWSRDQ
jgi:hypothetical protein